MNMNLRELYLADNKLNGLQDSAQLGNLLKFNCSLQILDLRNNHVLDSGVREVHPSLFRSPSTHCAQPGAPWCSALLSWGSQSSREHRPPPGSENQTGQGWTAGLQGVTHQSRGSGRVSWRRGQLSGGLQR